MESIAFLMKPVQCHQVEVLIKHLFSRVGLLHGWQQQSEQGSQGTSCSPV